MDIARAGDPFKGIAFVQDNITYNHTIPEGANHIKIGIAQFSQTEFVTGVTVDGVPAVKEIHFNNETFSQQSLYIYSLDNPTVGVVEVVVTLSGLRNAVAISQAYSGVDLVDSVPDAIGVKSAIAASATVDITPIADNCWVFLIGCVLAGEMTAGAGANEIDREATSNAIGLLCDSNGPITPPALYQATIENSLGDQQILIAAVSFAPGDDPPPPVVTPPPAKMLSAGNAYELVEDLEYPLPAKRVRLAFYSAAGTLEFSNDGSTWTEVDLDENNEAVLASKFIRVVDDDAVVSVKYSK